MRSQENPDIFHDKRACYGVLTATKSLLWSSHGLLSRSYEVLSDSLPSHNALTMLTMHALHFHGVHTALRAC